MTKNTSESDTINFFRERMSAYTTANLVDINPQEFQNKIQSLNGTIDSQVEGYDDPTLQRDLSIRFHWGHNHDFGTFFMDGKMGERHLLVPSVFHDGVKAFPLNLEGKRILDIGVWTGGMSMLFNALGAEVVSLEEVTKYADTCKYLRDAFKIKNWEIENISLYDLETLVSSDNFDYIMIAGILSHVTDIILSLRLCFNALKDGGTIMIEAQTIPTTELVLKYEGAHVVFSGSKEKLTRSGWNWFVPSPTVIKQIMEDVGFENVEYMVNDNNRSYIVGQRVKHKDMLRAGLARPNVK